MMKDDDFKLFRGFDYGRTDRRTDICERTVAFATENKMKGAGTKQIPTHHPPPPPTIEW